MSLRLFAIFPAWCHCFAKIMQTESISKQNAIFYFRGGDMRTDCWTSPLGNDVVLQKSIAFFGKSA